MNDFGQMSGLDEEFAAVRKFQADVEADPDTLDNWENLIKACESLEGGLSRNSNPQALASCRDAYERLLARFPLFFGYWKKYADTEFNIAGTESAEMVYERGVACNPHSVDLWAEYCRFKMDTCHDPDVVRELFERAAALVGIDYAAHPFWDTYLEFEQRQECHAHAFAILVRIIRIPMHQYSRYYEKLRTLAHTLPVEDIVPADVLARFQAESKSGSDARPELEVERDVRAKIDAMYYDIFSVTAVETNKRWTFESEMGRPYFHTTELTHAQLNAWRGYLDLEEAEGDVERIKFLYEKCNHICAYYEEFWFRYARWMSTQAGKETELRHIYILASFCVPVSRPGIRMQWAYFEESQGNIDAARDIHAGILAKLPDCIEVILSWAHLERRQNGIEAAIQVLKDQIDAPTVDLYTKAALVAEWAILLWKVQGSAEQARAVFLKNSQWYGSSRTFWEKWFEFELEQPMHSQAQDDATQRVKHVFEEIRAKSRLSPSVKRDLGIIFLNFLVQRGGKDAMKEFAAVDRAISGSSSVAALSTDGQNGAGATELDEASKQKAEARLIFFYDHEAPIPGAQGPADYN
ncbi:mRNA splicing protein [Drechmeria coniospora]|uniref:mRNA splicing protein n=1 Tax=Drechmeria coniospora TaxID=98403 RepID=A0A151GE64_DRECN|nr:mRNA splicing protein [Drechmeria coniospora]KYK55390.1 mRNA splicing protein [Drechmeria coniospora]ODA82005.1 hypothetical protein RJ55_00510 [Drechmeria coniospora]